MGQQRAALKNPIWLVRRRARGHPRHGAAIGWRSKVYMHVCLTADRSTGRMKVVHRDIATALKKSRRSIVNHLEELREHQICSIQGSSESACGWAHRGVRPLLALREVPRPS
jgi:hypothetical protein